jgi:hypothetical protein
MHYQSCTLRKKQDLTLSGSYACSGLTSRLSLGISLENKDLLAYDSGDLDKYNLQ